jgi:hypothetical protein
VRVPRTLSLLAVAAVLTAALAAPAVSADASSGTVSAKTLLRSLKVQAPETNRQHRYERDLFHYDDGTVPEPDHCDTRKQVLLRDALRITKHSKSCSVGGTWRSLYDDRVTNDPYSLEIDHLVPLAEAWHSGAWAWPEAKRIAFGNDTAYKWDLQAVTTALNEAKGADDPAGWMPPKNRCTYAEAWVAVKYRWHLSVDPAEKAALTRILSGCGSAQVLRPGTPDIAALDRG